MTGGYGKGPDILHGCTIAVEKGEIAVIVGPNGAGKTSLFRLLCGLDAPQAGRVLLDGTELHEARARRPGQVGLMFQNPDDQIIFPTVEEELALGLRPSGISRREATERLVRLCSRRLVEPAAVTAATSQAMDRWGLAPARGPGHACAAPIRPECPALY